jgi:hypothetical protein
MINYVIDAEVTNYTDCEGDEPNGKFISAFETFDAAREAAKEIACREAVNPPDRIAVCFDDRENGNETYDLYIVS